MSSQWYRAVLSNRTPMEPQPTDIEPRLGRLDSISAVIFDIYGTLIISGTGDVGSADEGNHGDAILQALAAAEIDMDSHAPPTIDQLHQAIRTANDKRLSATCIKPEVEIVDVWRTVLESAGIDPPSCDRVHRLAAEYESIANPTWPMPGAQELIEQLAKTDKVLGIVSNAQGFTLPLIEEISGDFGVDSVFDVNLCVFSYRYRQAKPAPRLFDVLSDGLNRAGIAPEQAIYVGNDRLNDVWAASQAGLRTAWFAGDRRSLRARSDDSRAASVTPDLILTRLDQLVDCI